ncbi:MAG: RNA-binding protein, partial [Clostridia bacterium]|nr:RNA-binding protein [Clostridia bacterium]
MKVSAGDIVYSIAGRDSGGYFVVFQADESYAYICDGRNRKTDRPKKKKIKHLKLGFGHSDYIERKILSSIKVTNAELRRELSQ